MRRLLGRVATALVSLIVALFVTFALLDAVPGDRATVSAAADPSAAAPVVRADALERLRIRHGLIDPETGRTRSLPVRFGRWATRAVRLDFAPPNESPARFRERLFSALGVTFLLGLSSLGVSFGLGLLLGAALATWRARRANRLVGPLLAGLPALPAVLLTTAAVLIAPALGLPSGGGLGCPPNESLLVCAFSLARQILLPVAVLSLGPTVLVARHVREAVAAAYAAPQIDAARGFGLAERSLRRRAFRAGLLPAATLLGSLAPALLGGSVVLERVFDLPGLGGFAFDAVEDRDPESLMAVTTLASLTAVLSLWAAETAYRWLDPRIDRGVRA